MPTPVHNHPPIAMRRVQSDKALRRTGDFCWQVDRSGRRMLVLRVPLRGCFDGYVTHWSIAPESRWTWNGNCDRPTLTPALHAKGIWHGHVRHGFLVEAQAEAP